MESKKVKKVEIEKIKRTSVAEKIAEELSRMVDSGDFEPGEALPPERDLAEMFGVGRSSSGRRCARCRRWASWRNDRAAEHTSITLRTQRQDALTFRVFCSGIP